MSIPLAFPPVEWEGRPLVDGGVVDNLPVYEARQFGGGLGGGGGHRSPPLTAKDYKSAFGVASQASNLLVERANLEFRKDPTSSSAPTSARTASTTTPTSRA